ncbi:hypothetical protein MKX41_18115 [Paenibacillus sp. FSL R5-0475]|uniref:hypothetical protein n=1 Tax=Paenibacillus sp. FSL R5-0475 TaxID=2921643 RepID=UPI0030FB2C11
MTRKIQAYFRTENEAEGAKIALISYKVDGLEVWPLTDPIGEDRRILFPIAPFSNTTLAAGTVGTLGTGSTPAAGAMLAPGVAASETRDESETHYSVDEDQVSADVADGELEDGDLSKLRYVMDLSVAEENYNEVVETLRGKGAFVEQFD